MPMRFQAGNLGAAVGRGYPSLRTTQGRRITALRRSPARRRPYSFERTWYQAEIKVLLHLPERRHRYFVFNASAMQFYSGEGGLHVALLVGLTRQHVAGKAWSGYELLPINALGPKDFPDVFQTPDKDGISSWANASKPVGNDSPDDKATPIKKLSDCSGVRCEDFRIGVNVQREHVQVQIQQKIPVRVAAEMNPRGRSTWLKNLVQVASSLHVAVSCHGREQELQSRSSTNMNALALRCFEPRQLNI